MINSFGEFLKSKRLEKKLTQKELAGLLIVSESAVSKWEKNVSHPDITLLPKLSEILGVTEHELITASIDKQSRQEKSQAKKWRTLSMTWNLFLYISYSLALISCFITNLAIDGRLTWFWIVVSALLVAFSFTNLPATIKKHKLLLIPLSIFLSLCLLLAVCCIYTQGNWFWIATLSILLGYIMIFTPIYIAKFSIFAKINKYNDFVSVIISFIFLNILLIVIDYYTFGNNLLDYHWFVNTALPITLSCYVLINIFMCVRFLKTNKLLKSSIILLLINLLYIVSPLIKINNVDIQTELDDINIFKCNFSNWQPDVHLENNIHLIIFLTTLLIAIGLLIPGLIRHFKKNKLK